MFGLQFYPTMRYNSDYWVVKLNAGGEVKWQKTMGGSGNEQLRTVLQAPDGGYIVAGSTTSTDKDVTGNHGAYDIWVVKLAAEN
jgi:hypothetical protein